ncbi:MAG TPA: hypothetical protein ENN60_00010 [archaeon]|nr:hypothetical protein [archaeon]
MISIPIKLMSDKNGYYPHIIGALMVRNPLPVQFIVDTGNPFNLLIPRYLVSRLNIRKSSKKVPIQIGGVKTQAFLVPKITLILKDSNQKMYFIKTNGYAVSSMLGKTDKSTGIKNDLPHPLIGMKFLHDKKFRMDCNILELEL